MARGRAPALAWRVDAGTKGIAFSEDNGNDSLERLIKNADLLIMNFSALATVPSSAVARLAQTAGGKQLVVSPRPPRNENQNPGFNKKNLPPTPALERPADDRPAPSGRRRPRLRTPG